ncbi:inositol 1,4,5-trisphosphate receptor-interacting protein-like 1 [Ammospiza caudacuta]|uniref:inositol 1,4,5-trisphosphate receptor-interacting protein-like 1 n=1 Tax=Ammospiza caudacuta TaxID=2857398 RepID=UPI002738CC98|nr:inositol 1,4,5-trisphosphate receptor-interacting protein-like 1 [Ammospiza caudacuta]
MGPMVFLFMLLESFIQYPQPVAEGLDEETRLRMEVRAKHLEWERLQLEQEVERHTQEQVQLLQLLAVAVLLVYVLVLWFIGWKSSLRREEDEEENRGANEEEVGNVAANEEDNLGNEAVNEAEMAANNNNVAIAVQEEDDFDDRIGQVIMQRIRWPVQDLQRGCQWTMNLMDNYSPYFRHVLSNSFYPVLQRAIGVGSAFEGWSPREQDVVYRVLIPMTPPRGHSFHLQLDSAGQGHMRNFRVLVQLECTCTREQQAENMLCFLHHPEEELRRNQDPSLLDTLCTGSYLDVQKTARWFYQLVRAIWPALPQSHNWHLVLLPSTRSCQFKVTNTRESFRIEMLFGVRRDDSAIFVSSQTREAHTASTIWPESYAVAEAEFFKHIARQAPPDSLYLKCLQFFTRLPLGFCFSTYTMKTIVMHLLNVMPASSWRRRDLLERLQDILDSLRLCVRTKRLNHFIVGNRRLPQHIHLPADVQTGGTYNLLLRLAQQPDAHAQAIHDYQVLKKWYKRILLAED